MSLLDSDLLIPIAIGLLWSIQTCGIGYVLIFYLLHECYIASRLKLFGVPTTGLITGTSSEHTDELGDEYFVHYEFSTNPPYPNPCWTAKIKISKSYYGECKKGETIRIIFDPITRNSDFYYDGYRTHICSKCDTLCFCFIIPFPITSIFTAIYYSFNYNIISGIACIGFGLFISIPVCIYLCKRRNTFCYRFRFKHSAYDIGISKEQSLKDIKDTLHKNHSIHHSNQNSFNNIDKILSIDLDIINANKNNMQTSNDNNITENKNEIIEEETEETHLRINTYSGPPQLNGNNGYDINIPFETKTKINSKRRTNSAIITNNKNKYDKNEIYHTNNRMGKEKNKKRKQIRYANDDNINISNYNKQNGNVNVNVNGNEHSDDEYIEQRGINEIKYESNAYYSDNGEHEMFIENNIINNNQNGHVKQTEMHTKKRRKKLMYKMNKNNNDNKYYNKSNKKPNRVSYDDDDIKMFKNQKPNTNNNPFIYDRSKSKLKISLPQTNINTNTESNIVKETEDEGCNDNDSKIKTFKSQTTTTISNEPDISPYIVDDGDDSISADTSILYRNTSLNKRYSYKTYSSKSKNDNIKTNNVITPIHIKYLVNHQNNIYNTRINIQQNKINKNNYNKTNIKDKYKDRNKNNPSANIKVASV